MAETPPPTPDAGARAPTPAPAGAGALEEGTARRTKRSVLFVDSLAGGVVRTGGMLVIAAVLGILVFLAATVAPLFGSADVHERPGGGRVPVVGPIRMLAIDEYRTLGLAIGSAPEVVWFRLDTGEPVHRESFAAVQGSSIVAASRTVRSEDTVVVAADGRLVLASVGFATGFVTGDAATDLRASMKVGDVRPYQTGVVRRMAGGNLLRIRPRFESRGTLEAPAAKGAVLSASYAAVGEAGAVVAVTDSGHVLLARETVTKPLAGDPTRELAWADAWQEPYVVPVPVWGEEPPAEGPTNGGGDSLPGAEAMRRRSGGLRQVLDALTDDETKRAGPLVLSLRTWVRETAAVAQVRGGNPPALLLEPLPVVIAGAPPPRVLRAEEARELVAALRSLTRDEVRLRPRGTPTVSGEPLAAMVAEEVHAAWVATKSGQLLRLDLRADPAVVRETRPVGRGATSRITSVGFVLGDRSIAVADGAGHVDVWSPVPDERSPSGDAFTTRRLHEFATDRSPVVTIAAGQTRRTLYFGHEDGRVSIAYAVNTRTLADVAAFTGPVLAIAAGSKDDGLVAIGPGLGYRGFDLEAPHPEVNVRALFGPVHYEGYAKPEYVYQSSAGTDEAEPKLSLTPLVFGTLKGTFYAMLFALPLALLAALYTSRFMHPRVRSIVKPGIEVMASLPSVVVGFLAALVIAPAFEGFVPAVFATLAGILFVGLAAGTMWHVLPLELRQAVPSAGRLAIAIGMVVLVGFVAVQSNGLVQRTLFSGPANPAGDFRIWLRGGPATGTGTPLWVLASAFLGAGLGVYLLRRLPFSRDDATVRRLEGVGTILGCAALVGLAGWLLEPVLFGDFRRFLVGDDGSVYDQRNSLVVGIAMGFAVIPIVYTIAEDALSAIPDSLTSAALACGASPWQAATRVVLPAAVPGIFSASMIGLGRAVGETMIVVMATGGTPILDASIWNGFRTLSNTIAIEMPEAPKEGTLFRVLFLSGLLLFAMTFVVNTLAELVRIRFRKRFRAL